jgi:diguanylate cyclase (GGDEF)-like protein
MSRQFRIEPSQMVVRYAIAIVLIVVFVVGGHAMSFIVAKRGAQDAETINFAGQQRMLSQRIALLSNLHNETPSGGYDALIEESIRAFETNHDWIMTNAVVAGTPVETHYSGVNGADLDQRSRAFAGLARTMLREVPGSQAAVQLTKRLEGLVVVDLLRDLHTAVALLEDAAETRQIYMERIQLVAVIATLLILALEIKLIFYPAHSTMVGMIGRLRREAWQDPLTGLTNRARFMARVSEMVLDPNKTKRLIVLALDLDGFKAVNDTLGHPVGDQVLKSVAKSLEARLQAQTRLRDHIVARFGGDEFMICGYLPSGDLEAFCVELGEILIGEIEMPIAVALGDGRMDRCVVGVSIGYSLSEQTGGNIDIFLSNADIALYDSKRRGKGVATAFRRSMREAAESRHHQTTELKSGIRGMEFQAYFQPQINLADGKLVGVEALARWYHPERGLIGPDQFIAVAEECHMIDALDGQIMLDAFQAYQQSRMQGFDLGKLSINASGPALREPDFCDLDVCRVQRPH